MCQGLAHKERQIRDKKKTYVQDTIFPQPQKLYTGMPVTPVTNSMSDFYIVVLYSTRMNHQFWYKSNYSILTDVFGISPIKICPMFTFDYIAHK